MIENPYPALVGPEEAGEGSAAPVLGAPADAGAFTSEGDPLASSRRAGGGGLFGSRPATGAHEVIIHTAEHRTSMADLTEEEFGAAVALWRERMAAHRGASYVHVGVNEGVECGNTVAHTHAHLMALSFVPAAVARERERVGAYRERTAGGSLLSDVLVEEVRKRERLVAIDDEAALVCPWASRSPYEMRLIPRNPEPSFAEGSGGAGLLRRGLRALAKRFDGPPDFNIWVRTAPHGTEGFHWHIDIAPHLTSLDAFQLGTEVNVNVQSPEAAAAELREAIE